MDALKSNPLLVIAINVLSLVRKKEMLKIFKKKISQYGTLTPKKAGTVKVTVKDTVNNKFSTCTVVINPAKEKPAFSTITVNTTGKGYFILMSLENEGNSTIRVLGENIQSYDSDYESYDRECILVDEVKASKGDFSPIEYLDIAPGEKATVSFMTTSVTWLDKYTTVYFDVEYQGDVYRYSTSKYYGTSLLK